jgi:hypothetical protein
MALWRALGSVILLAVLVGPVVPGIEQFNEQHTRAA